MWRKLSSFDIMRKIKITREFKPSSNMTRVKESSQSSTEIRQFIGHNVNHRLYLVGLGQTGEFLSRFSEMGGSNFIYSANPIGIYGICDQQKCCYATAAEAIPVSSSEDDEIRELVEEINKVEGVKSVKQPTLRRKQGDKLIAGMPPGRYNALRKRQVKIETEAWNEAAKEYQELLADMCEQKLAPNLPYMKSLFLGWFEPLTDAIKADQELVRLGKHKTVFGQYMDQLPADMMAVITMHKLMALLMAGSGDGTVTVVQTASQIGEAIEQEVLFRL